MPQTIEQNKNSKSPFFTVNLFKRIITALIFGGVTLWVLLSENTYIGYYMTTLCALVLYEWVSLVYKVHKIIPQRLVWLVLGGAYLMLGLVGFYQLYDYSSVLGVSLLFLIWSTDIGAYFVGRIVGGPKLAPSISPGKTWSGAFGGLLAAFAMTCVASFYFYEGLTIPLLSFFLLCSILGQIGDLLESKVKRYFNVKDSGKMLPGHGGFIDRLDSLIFVGFILFFFNVIAGYSDIFNL